jgi:CheY-like chemotaxis protein
MAASALVVADVVAHDRRVDRDMLIVDDNERFRSRARRMLEAAGYTVAEAGDGAAAVAAVRRDRPAVLLLDIELPDVSGLAIAERLAREPERPTVVLVSSRDATDFGERLARCGARGFLAKAELSVEGLAALLAE